MNDKLDKHKQFGFFHGNNLTIDQFQIIGTLGVGTFGKVKLAKYWQSKHDNIFAIKMLQKKEISKLNQTDHVRQERDILKQVDYPFIVKYYQSFQDHIFFYMVFEFVQGGELFKRLWHEGRFSQDVVLFYSSQILLTLYYLHWVGIVFWDLKPENLLLDKNGNIKLADFGFAKKLGHKEKTYTLCGTPEYLAPELIQSEKEGYTRAVDWWALGVLMYEMMVGYPPFYDKDPMGIYEKIFKLTVDFPEFLSISAKDLIVWLLNPKYKKRLGSSDNGLEIFRHEFFNGVPFDELEQGNIVPPWIPNVASSWDNWYFGDVQEDQEEIKDDSSEERSSEEFDELII